MTNLFLGVIALSVLVMAAIQVAAIVVAARAARRLGESVRRLEEHVQPLVANLQPIITNLQAVTADAARASAAASAQVERAGRLLEDLATRVDQTVMSAQEAIMRPARDGLVFLEKLRAIVFGLVRRAPNRPPSVDEDDALFIG